jgi:hypothetical protein
MFDEAQGFAKMAGLTSRQKSPSFADLAGQND